MRALPILFLVPVLVACTGPSQSAPKPEREDLERAALAFVPETIRIHPLTHLEWRESSGAWIVSLIEMHDRWGDTTKGVGELQVQLYRPETGLDAGIEVQELKWEIDLTDLEANALWFDPVTRMYRITLDGVPGWVADIARQPPGTGGRVRLRALLKTIGPDGRERVLRDDYLVQH